MSFSSLPSKEIILEDLDDENEENEQENEKHSLRVHHYSWHPHVGPHGRFHTQLPAMPDLRFEHSYLRSIARADHWWQVALITARDQILMPFTQGLLYNLAVCGWQSWNRNAQLSGQSVGARARRWWYGVNNWPLPREKR